MCGSAKKEKNQVKRTSRKKGQNQTINIDINQCTYSKTRSGIQIFRLRETPDPVDVASLHCVLCLAEVSASRRIFDYDSAEFSVILQGQKRQISFFHLPIIREKIQKWGSWVWDSYRLQEVDTTTAHTTDHPYHEIIKLQNQSRPEWIVLKTTGQSPGTVNIS
jgi:hypothetical protein